ncbi:MAG: dihydrofolate reductase [Candidatus Izemoplasma sp.]
MVSIIVAISKNNVIGYKNKMPWHYKEDLAYFKKTTLNHTVLMGSNTFKSILSYLNKPLPKRVSVVASKSGYNYPGIKTINNVAEYVSNFPKDEELFVIGGKMIYDLTIDLADRLYITHINQEFTGDTFFQEINYSKFKKISETVNHDLTFAIYERI